MNKKFFTIDDLYQFCKNNNFSNFSSKTAGAPLIVQSIGDFEADETSGSLMKVKLKACHTGKNANQSGITDEVMNQYKDTFKGKPILGAIYKTDTGEYEFRSHDVEVITNENGDEEFKYIEQPVGVISEVDSPYLEYDKDNDKNYLMVNGNIFTNYSKAGEILERRRTCKCSVEIAVNEMSYNCKEDYLSIDDFEFLGVTILGYRQDGVTEIQEGMKGSKITIDDFSADNNSMKYQNYQDKLIETLDKLNYTLEGFNKVTNKEGGDGEMENTENTVVETEGKVVIENEEILENGTVTEENAGENPVENVIETHEENIDNQEPEKFSKTFSIEISHEDIRYALYNLISKYDEEDNDYYSICQVYDDYFYMQGWINNKLYKVGYSVDGENVELSEAREEMFSLIVNKAEKDAIESMRQNYDELVKFKENTEKAAVQAEKDVIFADVKYSSVINTNAFKNLMEKSVEYSVEECRKMADEIHNDFSAFAATFAEKTEDAETKVLNFTTVKNTKEKKKPYGKLFD